MGDGINQFGDLPALYMQVVTEAASYRLEAIISSNLMF